MNKGKPVKLYFRYKPRPLEILIEPRSILNRTTFDNLKIIHQKRFYEISDLAAKED